MKYLRLGLTECTLLLNWFLINTKKDSTIKYDTNLINWLFSTSGFYDKNINGTYFDFNNEFEKICKSKVFNDYFVKLIDYLKNSDYFSICLHKRCFSPRQNELFVDYLNIKNIIDEKHSLFKKFFDNKKVLVVSSFAKLILQQIDSGNCEKIFPNFPKIIKAYAYTTPYTFFNTGNDNNILETAEKMQNDIKNLLSVNDFDVAIISCGAYGCLMGGYIHDELHKDVYVVGGSLLRLFGICSKRNPYHDNLPNRDLWIKEIPEEYKPKDYMKIENGTYW